METINDQVPGRWAARGRTLGLVVLALCAAVFVYRGPYRSLASGGYDFDLVYTATRTWLRGANPYDAAHISDTWYRLGNNPVADPAVRGSAVLLYPPSTFVVFAPVGALPYHAAEILWLALNTILWPLTAWAAWKRAGGARGGRLLLYGILVLLFTPAHACIALGQTAIIASALIAFALLPLPEPEPTPAPKSGWTSVALRAACLGLGACVKPQLGLPFIAYVLGRRQWKLGLGSLAVAGVVLGAGVWRLHLAHVPWETWWADNLHRFTLTDDGDPTRGNPLRFQLLNLQYLFHTWTENRSAVNMAVKGVVGMLALAYLLVDWRKPIHRGDTCTLACVAAAALLVVYHRSYDAVILVFALAWCVAAITDAAKRLWASLALVCVLAVGASLTPALFMLERRGIVPPGLAGSGLWEHAVMPQAVWAILMLGVVLVIARSRDARAAAGYRTRGSEG